MRPPYASRNPDAFKGKDRRQACPLAEGQTGCWGLFRVTATQVGIQKLRSHLAWTAAYAGMTHCRPSFG